MKNFNGVTVGSDVEVFLTANGLPISAVGLIDGGKEDPVEFLPRFGLQRDNVMAEYNIPAFPIEDGHLWSEYHKIALEHIKTIVPPFLQVTVRPSLEFPEEALQDPESCEFGCSPFMDIWKQNPGMVTQETIVAGDVGNLRFCGGHIHFGWQGASIGWDKPSEKVTDEEEIMKKLFWASLCDIFLWIPSHFEDTDDIRRQYYGKPGKVRYKEYGVEYRSLSNYFVASEELLNKVMQRIQAMYDYANTVHPSDWAAHFEENRKMVEMFVAAKDKKLAAEQCNLACKFNLQIA